MPNRRHIPPTVAGLGMLEHFGAGILVRMLKHCRARDLARMELVCKRMRAANGCKVQEPGNAVDELSLPTLAAKTVCDEVKWRRLVLSEASEGITASTDHAFSTCSRTLTQSAEHSGSSTSPFQWADWKFQLNLLEALSPTGVAHGFQWPFVDFDVDLWPAPHASDVAAGAHSVKDPSIARQVINLAEDWSADRMAALRSISKLQLHQQSNIDFARRVTCTDKDDVVGLAVAGRDHKLLRRALKAGADPDRNIAGKSRAPPLFEAISMQPPNYEAMKLLLRAGAKHKYTDMARATSFDAPERELLEFGLSGGFENRSSGHFNSELHRALTVRVLLENGVSPEQSQVASMQDKDTHHELSVEEQRMHKITTEIYGKMITSLVHGDSVWVAGGAGGEQGSKMDVEEGEKAVEEGLETKRELCPFQKRGSCVWDDKDGADGSARPKRKRGSGEEEEEDGRMDAGEAVKDGEGERGAKAMCVFRKKGSCVHEGWIARPARPEPSQALPGSMTALETNSHVAGRWITLSSDGNDTILSEAKAALAEASAPLPVVGQASAIVGRFRRLEGLLLRIGATASDLSQAARAEGLITPPQHYDEDLSPPPCRYIRNETPPGRGSGVAAPPARLGTAALPAWLKPLFSQPSKKTAAPPPGATTLVLPPSLFPQLVGKLPGETADKISRMAAEGAQAGSTSGDETDAKAESNATEEDQEEGLTRSRKLTKTEQAVRQLVQNKNWLLCAELVAAGVGHSLLAAQHRAHVPRWVFEVAAVVGA